MNLLRHLILAALGSLLAAVAAPAFAAGNMTGVVTKVNIDRGGGNMHFVYIEKTSGGQTACAAAGQQWWVIKDETSDVGKRQFAVLLTARLAGTPVYILGAGTCTRAAGYEDIDSVTF